MQPVLYSESLDNEWGTRECYLIISKINNPELRDPSYHVKTTAVAYKDHLQETINHLFHEDGESEKPLTYNGETYFDLDYRFKLQGYEIFHGVDMHYQGVIILWYTAMNVSAVLALKSIMADKHHLGKAIASS